jgi:hypothetical protein
MRIQPPGSTKPGAQQSLQESRGGSVDRDLAGWTRPRRVGSAGRPPLMIRCCEHNQRSDGGRRSQRRGRPAPMAAMPGRAAGPDRRPVWPGGATTAGHGVRVWAAGRPAPQELLDDRRACRQPHPRWDGSTCWPGRCGTTTACVPRSGSDAGATFALLPASRPAPPRRQARRYRMGIAPTLWASRLATM